MAGSLSASNPMVLSALAHTPWLLPPGTKLPYSGLENDLDGLLRTQASRSVQGFPAVTMVFFSHHHRTMLMNCVYSLSKFAGRCMLGKAASANLLRAPMLCEMHNTMCCIASDKKHAGVEIIKYAQASARSRCEWCPVV